MPHYLVWLPCWHAAGAVLYHLICGAGLLPGAETNIGNIAKQMLNMTSLAPPALPPPHLLPQGSTIVTLISS